MLQPREKGVPAPYVQIYIEWFHFKALCQIYPTAPFDNPPRPPETPASAPPPPPWRGTVME